MQAIKLIEFSVLIKDGKIKAWINVRVENEDIICDWNQYIFRLTDQEDVILKKWQERLENFEDARDLAVNKLEEAKLIYQDKNGIWKKNKNKISA